VTGCCEFPQYHPNFFNSLLVCSFGLYQASQFLACLAAVAASCLLSATGLVHKKARSSGLRTQNNQTAKRLMKK
jgi:hypothetical protein